jgi:hypothetical protein
LETAPSWTENGLGKLSQPQPTKVQGDTVSRKRESSKNKPAQRIKRGRKSTKKIDPLDEERRAVAALSAENQLKFERSLAESGLTPKQYWMMVKLCGFH